MYDTEYVSMSKYCMLSLWSFYSTCGIYFPHIKLIVIEKKKESIYMLFVMPFETTFFLGVVL
jgi:hypothetical protein